MKTAIAMFMALFSGLAALAGLNQHHPTKTAWWITCPTITRGCAVRVEGIDLNLQKNPYLAKAIKELNAELPIATVK